MKSQRWYYKLRGVFHANGPVVFEAAITEKQFRAYLRKYLGVSRLTNVEIWPTK